MKLEYKKDYMGQEGLYSVDGKHQVMMEWEREYMYACIDKLQPYGDVLEIGFGMGYSADRIQSFNVKTHTIIECNPVVLEKLEEYKKTHPNVIIVKGRWQDILQTCGKFDSIFFDDYLLEDKDDNIRFSNFLKEVLNNHSKKTTKISVYSTNDCRMLKQIENIHIESDEYKVDIPEHCNYAKGDKMYTILITKCKTLEDKLVDMINDPFNSLNNYYLALEYHKINQTAIALSYYLRCAEFTDNHVLASECLLRASFCINTQNGRDEKELYLIKQAISVSPNSIEPYYIASLYFSWRSGNIPEKRLWLDAYQYACLGINILENNINQKPFITDVGYKEYDIYFQKAFAGTNIGKIDEAREIYTNLLKNYELNNNIKNLIINNLDKLPKSVNKLYKTINNCHNVPNNKFSEYTKILNKVEYKTITKNFTSLITNNLSSNIIVIDDFYKDPDQIRDYALSLNYQQPENHGAVGYRCENGRKIQDGTKELFEKILHANIPDGNKEGEWNYSTNGCFQWCNASVPIVYHCDSQKYAGIIYLTPDAPPECGTSFFRHKKYKLRNSEIFSKSDWYQSDLNYKEPHLDKTQWEVVDSIGNVYNRLVIFDAQYIHAVSEYFGEDIHNSRLFQLFFFNIDK